MKSIEELELKLETLRLQLAACGVAAMSNTEETKKSAREIRSEYYSASFQEVCNAVDREMELRKERQKDKEELAEQSALLEKMAEALKIIKGEDWLIKNEWEALDKALAAYESYKTLKQQKP